MMTLFKKILLTLPPETAHNLVKALSRWAPKDSLRRRTATAARALKADLGGLALKNPVGLAAGFDKNGEMVDFLTSLGFGYLELGSVTARPCGGNARPRIFRLKKDRSLVNRMGLPNCGAEAFVRRLTRQKVLIPYGVNIAKTPDFAQGPTKLSGVDDFLTTFRRLHFLGNYTVFNLSCPNTGETRTFEDPQLFGELAREIQFARKSLRVKKPVLVKLSPDTEPATLSRLVELALKHELDGFVVTNTTTTRPGLKTPARKVKMIGEGGLSGAALARMANEQLRRVYEITGNDKIIIGVGGIMGFSDLTNKLACGASLFQVYTGLVYNGPFFVRELNRKLIALCRKLGIKNYLELRGKEITYANLAEKTPGSKSKTENILETEE